MTTRDRLPVAPRHAGDVAAAAHPPEVGPHRRGPAGRGWDVTAIVVSWAGGLLLIAEAAQTRDFSEEALLLHVVAGIVLSLALWWRRSHPMAVALFLAVAAVVADGAGLAGLVGLYTAVSLRRGRPVVVIVLANLVGGFAYALIYPQMAEPAVVNVVLTIAILAATVAMGMAVRSRRELVESLRERAVRAEEEARRRADHLRARERERIAREMHDVLAHRISMISLHAGALQIRPDLTGDEVAKAAATIRDSAHHALEDLREILGVLRAGPDDERLPQPDLPHLGELVSQAREVAGIDVTIDDRLGRQPVGVSLGRTVYRLVQEGLTNAGKHAPGSPVTLLLERGRDDEMHVRVSNPLSPLPRASPAISGPELAGGRPEPAGVVPGAGSGLIGLAERVELLDGRLRHGVRGDPRTGLTFELEAWLPWPAPSGS